MEKLYYTLDQANAMIPFIKTILKDIQKLKSDIDGLILTAENDGFDIDQVMSSQDLTEAEESFRMELDDRADQIHDLMLQMADKGIMLKDIDDGIVDFYTRIQGREAFLCWKWGENEITHWHDAKEGFSGRKNLMEQSLLREVTQIH